MVGGSEKLLVRPGGILMLLLLRRGTDMLLPHRRLLGRRSMGLDTARAAIIADVRHMIDDRLLVDIRDVDIGDVIDGPVVE